MFSVFTEASTSGSSSHAPPCRNAMTPVSVLPYTSCGAKPSFSCSSAVVASGSIPPALMMPRTFCRSRAQSRPSPKRFNSAGLAIHTHSRRESASSNSGYTHCRRPISQPAASDTNTRKVSPYKCCGLTLPTAARPRQLSGSFSASAAASASICVRVLVSTFASPEEPEVFRYSTFSDGHSNASAGAAACSAAPSYSQRPSETSGTSLNHTAPPASAQRRFSSARFGGRYTSAPASQAASSAEANRAASSNHSAAACTLCARKRAASESVAAENCEAVQPSANRESGERFKSGSMGMVSGLGCSWMGRAVWGVSSAVKKCIAD